MPTQNILFHFSGAVEMATFGESPAEIVSTVLAAAGQMGENSAASTIASTAANSAAAGSTDSEEQQAHVCATAGCGKPATLACPTCLKLGLAPARFCNQDCFKNSWKEHNAMHKSVKASRVEPNTMPTEFRNYSFTGSLRPYQQSPKRTVPDHIPRPDYANHPQASSE
jgi:hypothetical protein